jgi:RimJ/RimL family protein N-acetyltransferase
MVDQPIGFHATESFDIGSMAAFMRQPEIYWAVSDAAAAPPEMLDIESYLSHTHTWTLACCYGETIIGGISFVLRTTICAEAIIGFHPNFRGKVAFQFCRYAIGRAFTDKGLLKLYVSIPSDNKRAIMMAGALGFGREGRLTKAIVRGHILNDTTRQQFTPTPPGLYDLVLLGLSKE